MSKYTAEQVEDYAQACALIHKGPVIAEMLRDYAALLRERESANHYFPKVSGISRDGECNKALSIFFASRPTDDEMRAVHDYLNRRESAKAAVTDEMVEAAMYACGGDKGAYWAPETYEDWRAALEAVAPMLASARVPDAMEVDDSLFQTWDHDTYKEYGYALGWNACRAATLAAAPKPETEE